MFRNVSFQRLLLCSAVSGSLIACGGDDAETLDLQIQVRGPDDSPTSLTTGFPAAVDSCVETLRVAAYQGTKLVDRVEVQWRDRTASLPNVAFGRENWITVEGISGGGTDCAPEGEVVASGSTARFTFGDNDIVPELMVMTALPFRFQPAYWFNRNSEASESLLYELPGNRAGHTMTELPDKSGQVVIGGAIMGAGGIGDSGVVGFVDTIEFFDAFTGEFLTFFEEGCTSDAATCALRLPTGTGFHAAAAFEDGSILISGGLVDSGFGFLEPSADTYVLEVTGRAEGYLTPVTVSGAAPEMRAFHTATRMDDGRIVIAGGIGQTYGVGAQYLTSIYEVLPEEDPRDLVVTDSGARLTVGRALHTATNLSDNGHGVMVVGGRNAAGVVGTSEVLFQFPIGVDSPLEVEPLIIGGNAFNDLGTPRFGHSAVHYTCPNNDDEFLAIVGGYTTAGAGQLDGGAPSATVEVYQPALRFRDQNEYEWASRTATLPGGGRAFGNALTMPLSGDLMFLGGTDGDGNPTNTADRLFNVEWADCEVFESPQAVGGGMGAARAYAAASVLSNGFVFVTGGFDGANTLESSEFYNPNDYSLVADNY